MTRNSVAFLDIFMKLYRNVYQVKTMCGVLLRLISFHLSYDPLIVFYAYFVEFIFCTPHNSLIVHNFLMQVYRNVY